MNNKEFNEDYSYIFTEKYLETSPAALRYLKAAEAYRLSWKKDNESRGKVVGPSYPHNTCIPMRETYEEFQAKEKDKQERFRIKQAKEVKERYKVNYEDWLALSYKERQELERQYNLTRTKIVIKTNNGTIYI